MDTKEIKIIAFDADDTLWQNEVFFREAEDKFAELMAPYMGKEQSINVLFSNEMKHLHLYGYGIKGFMLSMVETAMDISKGTISAEKIYEILEIGRRMMNKPVELLDDVESIFNQLNGKYRIILATKGDLIDQERKLYKSGLEKHFHHVEVMSEKKEGDYRKLIRHLDIEPHEFLMVGNSMKSDIIPVLNIGGKAIHIPHEITWQHELVEDGQEVKASYHQLDRLSDIVPVLR